MSLSNISLIKKLSLVLGRKAYLIYTKKSIPSLLVPLPSIDKTLKSAIYKTFSNLTNNQILTFHNQAMVQKDLDILQKESEAYLNVEEVNFPQQLNFQIIENIQVMPETVFLAVNSQNNLMRFMKYQDLKNESNIVYSKSEEVVNEKKKPLRKQEKKKQKEEKKASQDDLNIKGEQKKNNQMDINQEFKNSQFKDEKGFEKKQMSTWNEQSPQLSTPPEAQPKQDISSLRTNKFIPLAILTDNNAAQIIQIDHIQTPRQYLFLQFLKLFCLANILCVYGLIKNATRSENHRNLRKMN